MSIPMRGLSEVIGIMEDTVLRNIVSDKRIVTPIKNTIRYCWALYHTSLESWMFKSYLKKLIDGSELTCSYVTDKLTSWLHHNIRLGNFCKLKIYSNKTDLSLIGQLNFWKIFWEFFSQFNLFYFGWWWLRFHATFLTLYWEFSVLTLKFSFNIVSASLPRESFSPESGGRVKSRTAMDEISKQGTIKLKK